MVSRSGRLWFFLVSLPDEADVFSLVFSFAACAQNRGRAILW